MWALSGYIGVRAFGFCCCGCGSTPSPLWYGLGFELPCGMFGFRHCIYIYMYVMYVCMYVSPFEDRIQGFYYVHSNLQSLNPT